MLRSQSFECLEELRDLIEDSSDNSKILSGFSWLLKDEKFLLHFIRGCKYSTKTAFDKMQLYLKERVNHSEVLQDLLPSKMRELTKVLKHRGPNGELITLQRASDWDPKTVTADEYLISAMGNHEVLWDDEICEKNGYIGLWDTSGFGLAHLKCTGPRFIAKVVRLFLNASPIRVKGLHIFNSPPYFFVLLNAVKYLLPKKFKDRIVIYGNNKDEIFSTVPAHKLPICIGGTATDEEAFRDDIFPALLAKEKYFLRFTQTLKQIHN